MYLSKRLKKQAKTTPVINAGQSNENVHQGEELLFMYNESKGDLNELEKKSDSSEKLTKGQIVDYLQSVDKLPTNQLYNDLKKLGLESYEPPKDGIYKFIH